MSSRVAKNYASTNCPTSIMVHLACGDKHQKLGMDRHSVLSHPVRVLFFNFANLMFFKPIGNFNNDI